jgi:hypothetical protein
MAVASLANCATHDKHFEASQAIDSFRLVNPWLLVSLVLLIYEWSGEVHPIVMSGPFQRDRHDAMTEVARK